MALNETQYPIELPVSYQMGAGEERTGRGRTLVIGRSLVRFATDRDLEVGRRIVLLVAWPARLMGGVGLNLCLVGKITRSLDRVVEVQVTSYDFKTRQSARIAEISASRRAAPALQKAAGAGG